MYVFLFVSRRRGLLYGLTTIAAAIAVLLAMTLFYPAYINVSIVDNTHNATYYDVDHMKRQTLDWLLFSLPLTRRSGPVCPSSRDGGTTIRISASNHRRLPSPQRVNVGRVSSASSRAIRGAHDVSVSPRHARCCSALLPQIRRNALGASARRHSAADRVRRQRALLSVDVRRFHSGRGTFARLLGHHRNAPVRARIDGDCRTAGARRPAGRRFRSSQYFGTPPSRSPMPGLVPADVVRRDGTVSSPGPSAASAPTTSI